MFRGKDDTQDALWVIGGDGGSNKNDVWKSTDGSTWTEVTSNAGFSGRSFHTVAVFDNALWVIGGDGGSRKNDVWKSTEGLTWTEVTADSTVFFGRYGHTVAVFNDGSGNALWVIGGIENFSRKNDVWKSTDGSTWTKVKEDSTTDGSFSARSYLTSAVFGDGLWIIGGSDGSNKNDVWKYQ